ncbi:MAG: PAS domain S-box protein [Desulfobacterales bacterium]
MSEKLTYEELEQRIQELEQAEFKRKRAVKALRESEVRLAESNQLLAGVLEHTHILTAFLDPQFNFVWVNQAYAAAGKHEPSFFPGKNHFDLYPHEENQAIFQRVVETGEPFFVAAKPFEYSDQPERGVTYWDWSLIPVKDDTGKVTGLVFTLAEVTERIRAEEAFRESEERFRAVAETAVEAIISIDSHDDIIFWNKAAENMFGYTVNEAMGKPMTMIMPARFHDRHQAGLKRVLSGEPSALIGKTIEVVGLGKDGREFPIELSIATWKMKTAIVFTSIIRDITLRKKAEGALKESEEKYRLLVENATDAIFIAQEERILFPNPKAIELTGYSADELYKVSFVNFIHPEDKAMVLERHKRRLKGEEPATTYSFRIINKAGQELWVESNVALITWGEKPATLNFLRDITLQKKLETQVQQAQKMEAIGTLSGGIAHDFNNILSAIMGYTEISLDSVERETQLYDNLQEVFHAGNRAKDLVKQILAFSRQTEQERKPVQIKPIVNEALQLLRASLPSTVEVGRNIQSDALVLADPIQIHQVLMNLCTNAENAMREKGGVLEVKLENVELEADFTNAHTDMKPGAYIQLTVSDTGHGIPSHVLDRIFDPFFTTKEKGEGTGMGLSVIHGIVGSQGGAITVDSQPGQGSTFKVYLPIIERREKPQATTEEPIPTGSERILFVDDEPALTNIGKQILESLGYYVETRTSSIEALELFKAQSERFDLVITDMTMPHLTGDGLAKELIRIKSDIPVILCTGFSATIDDQKAMAMGIRAFAFKPIVKREIAIKIREVLDQTVEKKPGSMAHILLIDDDAQIRTMLRQILETEGYEVVDASNGKEGIRLYREDPADLVITDIIMPEKEGIEMIMELKKDFPDVKIIAISAGGQIDAEKYLRTAKMLGAKFTFAKPFERKELLDAVKEIVG